MSNKRICIIGAGPSGMSVLYHFANMDPMPEVTVFEKQETWGGLWNLSWKTGVDEKGEPVHASMYRNLWTIGAKEFYEYPDYTYEKHFGCVTPSYAPRLAIRNYLEGRWTNASKSDLRQFIKFNHVVRYVKHSDDTGDFRVTVEDFVNHTTKDYIFTHVIVSTGIYSFPNMPDFPGLNSFQGRILHSHDFRDAREFKDQRVLLIGAAYSGEDIGLQLIKYGAKRVILCYRNKPKSSTCLIPKEMEEKPIVDRFDTSKAYFTDGTCAEVDAVILTTGYRNHFPFLEDKLRINEETHPYPEGLYEASVFYKHGDNRLFYVGVQEQFHTFTYFEATAYWICKYITGQIKGEPKSKEEMMAKSKEWFNMAESCKSEADMVTFQAALIKHLVEAAGYPFPAICKMETPLYEWIRLRKESHGLAKFRDASFRSIFTGNMATSPVKPFMEQYDDSLEAYLNCK